MKADLTLDAQDPVLWPRKVKGNLIYKPDRGSNILAFAIQNGWPRSGSGHREAVERAALE
jgi:hypothetical protein